jgi:hypothetical protein
MARIGKPEPKRRWNSFDRSTPACESFRVWGGLKQTDAARVPAWAGIALVAALTVGAHAAYAVDVVNRDKVQREVTVNRADGSSDKLTLKPGQKLPGVCSDCVVLMGDTSVEAKGKMTVKVEGGKVSIGSQR